MSVFILEIYELVFFIKKTNIITQKFYLYCIKLRLRLLLRVFELKVKKKMCIDILAQLIIMFMIKYFSKQQVKLVKHLKMHFLHINLE